MDENLKKSIILNYDYSKFVIIIKLSLMYLTLY